jgi:membrane-bound inhibitor of C-type lysozyme
MFTEICLTGLALGAFAAPLAAQESPVLKAVYTCERGVKIPVAYIMGKKPMAVLWAEGQLVTLSQSKSDANEPYRTAQGTSGYVWWSEGKNGKLDWFDKEKGEDVTLFAFCKTPE